MVEVGLTVVEVPVTVPRPWLMDKEVAPVTCQDRVELCPEVMVAGVAVKEEITGTGLLAVLLTVTLTAVEVAVLPAASLATAVRLCTPLLTVVVFQVMVKGLEVSSEPKLEPSSLNCTPTTPTLSVAVALTATEVPVTVALLLGAVRLTEGLVVSSTSGVPVTVTVVVAVLEPAALVAVRV